MSVAPGHANSPGTPSFAMLMSYHDLLCKSARCFVLLTWFVCSGVRLVDVQRHGMCSWPRTEFSPSQSGNRKMPTPQHQTGVLQDGRSRTDPARFEFV